MLVIVASFKALPDKENELGELLKSLVPKVQDEEGAMNYTLHRAIGEPGRFMFYEAYRDKEALEFHSSTSYFKELIGAATPLLAEPPDIKMFKDLAAIKR